MSYITKIIGLKKFDDYGIVTVRLDDGGEALTTGHRGSTIWVI